MSVASSPPCRVLVLGGTRHVGRAIVEHLAALGSAVTRVTRGQARAPLPTGVQDLRADRRDPGSLAAAIGSAAWDLVVDTLVWNADDARLAVQLLHGRTARYVAIGTGQVYLVRRDLAPPFAEAHYDGPLMDEPFTAYDRDQWRYGIEKREAEAVFDEAAARGFPVTTLRLPMVHGPHDPYQRFQHYLWRLRDAAPLLVPVERPDPMLRHVDVRDVALAVARVAAVAPSPGRAFNVGAVEPTPLHVVLERLAGALGVRLERHPLPAAVLEGEGYLPLCGPFSQKWMSALDPARAVTELGIHPRPITDTLDELLPGLLADSAPPSGFAEARARERALLASGA